MPPELGAGVVVVLLPLPEPVPLDPGVVGLVVVPVELEPLEPLVLPEAPLRASVWHLSRSAPVRLMHLLASLPDAPDAAPAEPEALPEVELSLLPEDELPAAGAVVLPEDELPVEGVADGVVALPDAPAPVLPEAPVPEPEDCENATPDRARSAAAVAAVMVFNIMREISFEGWLELRGFCTQGSCRLREKFCHARDGNVTCSTQRAHPERKPMERIEKSIEVAAPVRAVYNQWTQFEEFPRFMAGVKEVRQLDDTHVHWHAEIWGKDKEWDAEITEQVPDQVIAWRSTSGAPNAGTVRFEPVSHDRTRVKLTMEYQPEGVVEKTGDAVGVFSSRVQNTVEDFKKFIEKRGAETGGWRGEVHGGRKAPTSKPQGPGGST